MENLKLKVKLSAYSKGVIPKKLTDLENDGDFVQDPNYVHTDNNYTNEDKERLSHYDKDTVLDGAVRYDINQTLTEQERNRVKDALQIPQDIEQFQGRVEDLETFQGTQEGINQGNDTRFGTIEGDILNLQGDIGSLESNIETIEGNIEGLEQNIEDLQTDKLDKNLGAENEGKILSIKNDGDIIPVEFPEVVFPDNKTITKNSEGELQAKALIRSDGSLITVENINDLQLDVADYKYNNNNRVQAVENKNITQQTEIDYVTKKVNTLKGAGGYLNSADFGNLSDKDQEYIKLHLNAYALTEIGITDYLDIWNGTKVKNEYDGHTWILTNTQDTDPAIFEWTDNGIDYVAQATNTLSGIVKGSNDLLKVKVDMFGEMSVNGLSEALEDRYTKEETYSQEEVDQTFVAQEDGKGLSTNDFDDNYKGQVESNTTDRHTHSNKDILDNTTASYTTEEAELVSKIITDGDGSKALLNNGSYGEVGKVDTVNNVGPDENKNISLSASDLDAYTKSEVDNLLDEIEVEIDNTTIVKNINEELSVNDSIRPKIKVWG